MFFCLFNLMLPCHHCVINEFSKGCELEVLKRLDSSVRARMDIQFLVTYTGIRFWTTRNYVQIMWLKRLFHTSTNKSIINRWMLQFQNRIKNFDVFWVIFLLISQNEQPKVEPTLNAFWIVENSSLALRLERTAPHCFLHTLCDIFGTFRNTVSVEKKWLFPVVQSYS